MKALLCFLLVFAWSFEGLAHTRLLPAGNTPPRSNSSGLKSGPCGGIAKGTPQATFNAGQIVKVQWEETIDHPGYFEISISSDNDQTFTLLTTVQDTLNDGNTPHRYEVDVQLPAGLNCNNCTIQMVQWMTENPANPTPYFSCADITIGNQSSDTPTTPIDQVPSTPSDDNCHN